jgi:Domain of unknown function (DUF5615)
VKLLLDEHYADDIAAALRAAGHDAVTVSERALKGLNDEPLLALAASEVRALLTNIARASFRSSVSGPSPARTTAVCCSPPTAACRAASGPSASTSSACES